MDQSCLISVLAKKYEVEINSDSDIMELYNKLCTNLDVDEKYKKQRHKTIKVENDLTEQLNKMYDRMAQLEACLIEILYGKKFSEITKRKLKEFCNDRGIHLGFTAKGKVNLYVPIGSSRKC